MSLKYSLTPDKLEVFESVPDLYLILSPELHILTASDAYLAATFTSRRQIVGKHVFEAFPDNPNTPQAASVTNLRTSFREVLESGKPHRMALQRYDVPRPLAPGGFEEKYWEPVNTPVLDEQGEVLYIIHKVSDVTEQLKDRKQIQELTHREQSALSQVEWEQKKLQSIFMQAPVAIGIYGGRKHVIELVNPRMSELLGHPAEDLLGRPLFEALPEVKGQGFEEILSEVYATGIPYEAREVPATLRHRGKLVPGFYNFVYQPLRTINQQVTGIIQICSEVTEQVLARQKVEEGERQLRLITDSLPVLIGYLDKEEKFRFANKSYEEWFPWKAGELPGRPVREVIGEEAYQQVQGYIQRALAGERLDFNARMPYRNGFAKYIQASYIPDMQQGEVAGFYTLVTDVTEQTEAREQLEENEEKYRSLFETMDQGFCILEMIFDAENKPVDYRFLETNRTFEQQTGLKDAKGKTARELVPNLEDHWFAIYGKVALTGEPAHLTQGSEAMGRWFEINAFRQGGSESRKVALLFSDVTQRKQSEQALKENKERLSRVIEGSNDGIYEWDFRKDTAWWNQRFDEILGVEIPEEKRGLTALTEYLHPDDTHLVPEALEAHLERGEKYQVEYRIIRPSGEIRNILSKGKAVQDEQGNATMLSGTITDFTERRQAEEDLKEKNKQLTRINNDLDNFIYTASHDLKAPILNIEGLVNLLDKAFKADTPNKEKIKTLMGMIHTSIGKFKETIKDLTEVAKVESNAAEEVSQIGFEALLKEVKLDIKNMIDESEAIIEADFSQAPAIYHSKKNLRSILYNLLSNAIKYRSPLRRPHITITTSKPDSTHLLLSVQDNGVGIKEKDKAKVFMMFKRLHQHVEGTGIGMAIVKKIIDNSGGKIALESEKGKGSLFKIYFKEEEKAH